MSTQDAHSEEILHRAVAHHQANRFAEAEALYRQMLAAAPGHARALDLLGVLAAQTGRPDEGIELLQRAIAADPRLLSAYQNLGHAYRRQGRVEESLAAYRRLLELEPGNAHALNQVGELLEKRGGAGDADAALASFREAVRRQPDYPKALFNLGNALAGRNDFAAAVSCFERLLALKPDFVDGFTNLGNALVGVRNFDQALACYDHVLRIKPGDPAATVNRAHALAASSRFEEAFAAYEAAIRLNPANGELHTHAGEALMELDRLPEAVAAFRRGAELSPGNSEGQQALVIALKASGQLNEALEVTEAAIRAAPRRAGPRQCRVELLSATGQVHEALAEVRQIAAMEPDNAVLASSVVSLLNYVPGIDHAALCAAARTWGERFADPLLPSTLAFDNDRSPARRLRIGYVSPDFHGHPVGFNILPLMREHDRRGFEVVCFAQETNPDAVTAEFQRLADLWRDVRGMSDADMADLIRNDRIDILVDLALHTGGNRLLVFARKPAPVQVTFAGYPGTTGVKAIDYRLTDPYLDPPGSDTSAYAERSVRLPDSFWCYDPLAHAFPVNELPARSNGFITFGCLNNFCKTNAETFELWARALRAAPGSRMLLLAGEGSHRDRARNFFEAQGVDPARIQFETFRPRIKYLELYRGIDIGLDTLPYNGHTTSLDSYWMGVPVVTLVGTTIVGRAGLSQLTNLGLTDLIARTPEEFVRIASELAANLPRLAELRATLRETMRASPLIDGRRFARAIEAAYRTMWHTYCSA
jgi:predicted O-linked N-acetylglucosamine transferase (SPINDLY family)